MNKKNLIVVLALSIMHFLCDFICGYRVVGVLGHKYIEYALYIFIVYNSLAFLFQPIIGIIIDKFFLGKSIIIFSVLCLLLGIVVNNWLISIIFLGVGNQIFHVIGGKICTNINSSKASHLGVFVSLGAVGLALGSNFYELKIIVYLALLLYLILSVLVILNIKNYEQTSIEIQHKPMSKVVLGTSLMVIVVFIRSFLGKIIHFDFEMTLALVVLFPCFASFGKLIGGFIRDKFGSLITVIISMSLCCIILIFFSNSIILMLIGMILINISMPISLYELNKLNQGYEGFNFGILAAVLFPGVFLGIIYPYDNITYIIMVVISSLLTIFSIYMVRKWRKLND